MKNFWKNPLGVISLCIIIAFILISILGYLITPDSTPHCNEQHLEIAVQKPGFKVAMLEIQEQEMQKFSLFHIMLFGKPQQTTNIPISNYEIQPNGDLIYTIFDSNNSINNDKHILKNKKYTIKQRKYLLGTDRYGRCVLSQLLIGTRVSLSVGFIAVFIALLVGILLGSIAGFYSSSWLDNIIMWIINVVWSLPTILLVIAITFALGKGFWQVFIAVGLTMWVDIARLVRGSVMSLKEKEFVLAAKSLGYSFFRIILRHILPNILSPLSVVVSSCFATAILQEAGLSFLGIGIQPPMVSWGQMVKENYGYLILDASYLAILPALFIMLLVLNFFLLSNALKKSSTSY